MDKQGHVTFFPWVFFCSGRVQLVHLAPAHGANDYTIDPLTGWVSFFQPIQLWALQLSEPSQPHCCEWQFVQHCNLSGNEIPTAMSSQQTLSHKSPWSWRAVRAWQGSERAQVALEITGAQISLAAQSTQSHDNLRVWDLRVSLGRPVSILKGFYTDLTHTNWNQFSERGLVWVCPVFDYIHFQVVTRKALYAHFCRLFVWLISVL